MAEHPPQTLKIAALEPSSKCFSLLFELTDISSNHNGSLVCRAVDDTGIVNAKFDLYCDRLESGVVYHMTNLKCAVVDSHLQIVMSQSTSVTKEADKLGFRDKANDVSKKFYATKQQISELVKQQSNNGLILLSPEEAAEQVRLKRQFDEQTKPKGDRSKKPNPEKINARKQKEVVHQPKSKVAEAQNKKPEEKPKQYKEAKPKYKEKVAEPTSESKRGKPEKEHGWEEKVAKREYKQRQPSPVRKQKSKSIVYKLKESSEGGNGGAKQGGEYQRPKFVEKKQNNGECVELITVVAHLDAHVNVRAWICSNKRNERENEHERMIADKTGSLWMRVMKLNLEGSVWYEMDNLEVTREEGRLILKQTELSEARQLDYVGEFNLKPISAK